MLFDHQVKMAGCKNQLIIKYHNKFLVSNNVLSGISCQKIQTTTSTYKVSIKFWQNINKEFLKTEYFIILSQYFGNFMQEFFVGWPHDCLCKVSKILVEFYKVFNFEKFLIYVLPKFNWNLLCASCYLYLLIGNLTQKVYNDKFLNVSNEVNLSNVRN